MIKGNSINNNSQVTAEMKEIKIHIKTSMLGTVIKNMNLVNAEEDLEEVTEEAIEVVTEEVTEAVTEEVTEVVIEEDIEVEIEEDIEEDKEEVEIEVIKEEEVAIKDTTQLIKMKKDTENENENL